jgi:hypothetical protein
MKLSDIDITIFSINHFLWKTIPRAVSTFLLLLYGMFLAIVLISYAHAFFNHIGSSAEVCHTNAVVASDQKG